MIDVQLGLVGSVLARIGDVPLITVPPVLALAKPGWAVDVAAVRGTRPSQAVVTHLSRHLDVRYLAVFVRGGRIKRIGSGAALLFLTITRRIVLFARSWLARVLVPAIVVQRPGWQDRRQ